MIRYKLRQVQKVGGFWESEPITAADRRAVVQTVNAGFLGGEPRWAVEDDSHFIYGLSGTGAQMKTEPLECSVCRRWHGREIQHAAE